MGKIKKTTRIPSIELEFESDNAKNDFDAQCSGKDVHLELYEALDLNGWEKDKFEKISHYAMVEKLHEDISGIGAFFSWNRTFNSCNRWDFYSLWWAILISMFTSYKENYMWKKWVSWGNRLDQINNEDLVGLDIRKKVKDIKGPADKLNSDKWIISEIRNALDHTRYIASWNTVYVRNPKTWFEAKVPFSFLHDFITVVQEKSRREAALGMEADDKSIYKYPNNYKFDNIKNKVHYHISINSDKWNPAHPYSFDEYKELMQLNKNWEEIDRAKKEIKFTNQQESIAKTYFNENGKSKRRKRHKIDYKNLKYLWMNLTFPPEQFMWEILELIRGKVQNNDYKFYSTDFVDECGKHLCKSYSLWSPAYRRWESDVEISELFYFENALSEQKLEDGQSILKQYSACIDFADKYFRSHWYEYIEENIGEKRIGFFKKWNWKIKISNIYEVCWALNSHYYFGCQVAESFPDWLKIQFIESVYVNELITLQNNNAPWLIWSWSRNPNDEFTNREHVRNALVHNNYTMLHWVDEIVLRDWYNKNTDTWEREETINLPKLYEETYKEMVVNMNKDAGMRIRIINNKGSK